MSDPKTTSALLDRLDAALGRVEIAASAQRRQRKVAQQRFETLERGTEEALHALDRLLTQHDHAEASAA